MGGNTRISALLDIHPCRGVQLQDAEPRVGQRKLQPQHALLARRQRPRVHDADRRLLVNGQGRARRHAPRVLVTPIRRKPHDTRISPYFAFEGHGWNSSASAGYHSTTEGEGIYANMGAGTYGILELPGRQGILGRLRADVMVGNAPEQATLRLGGLYRGARGYESDAARSEKFRAIATLEHRHAFFTGARVDFWGSVMWTRLEGAFFANATYLPGNDSQCTSPMFYDVGYGLRFIGDVLNISPAALVVDVGLPLTPCAKRNEHQAVTVYLSFIQSLSGF